MDAPSRNETSWGIDPVPERLRVLGGFDLALLWGNLGVSLLVVVAGAILVPALSLPAALVAIVVGCLVGNLMLATAGLIGAQARVPAMTLMRAPLGSRGSYLPTAINIVQCLGWTVFELLVIATAAAALSDELLGVGAQWAWTLVFGAAALAMGLLGPIGVVRTVLRRVAIWVVPVAIAYLIWWALTGGGLSQAWNNPGAGGLSTWQGIDIVVGVTVSWVPLAADYTRFARTPRGAFWGTGIGYLLPDALLLALGAVILLTRDVGDAAALPAAVAAGGIVALAGALRAHRRGDRRGVRERVLGRRLVAEPLPRRAAATSHRRHDDGRDRRRPRARADELPVVPLPARLVLRAPVRRVARTTGWSRAARTTRTTSSARLPGGPG